jgi:hypothetical protein
MQKLSTVISYSSLEQRFLSALLSQSSIFSDDIILVIFKCLLNGKPENWEGMISQIRNLLPTAKISVLDYDPKGTGRYHHNLARWVGAQMAKHENILFLDGDEIPEGQIIHRILEENILSDFDGVDFACHWYFREPQHRAIQLEHCGLLVKKKIINESTMFSESERWHFRRLEGIRYAPMISIGGKPLMHHFSWVRTKEEMLNKVSGWGHKNDKDWTHLIEEEFAREFNGTDFVHGYQFETVSNKFNINI